MDQAELLIKEVERLRLTRPERVTPGDEKTPYDMVLVGETVADWDLQAVQPLMEQLGVTVTGVFGGNTRAEDVVRAFDASLNVAGVGRPATAAAQKIWDGYLIPYIWASFTGLGRTGEALAAVGRHFGLVFEAEAVAAAERRRVEPELAALRRRLRGKTAVVCAGDAELAIWIEALQELGMEVVAGVCLRVTETGCAPAGGRVAEGVPVYGRLGFQEIVALLAAVRPGFVLYCGPPEQATGFGPGVPVLNVRGAGRDSYAGYSGFVRLARDIGAVLGSKPIGESA